MKFEVYARCQCHVGEGPIWCDGDNCLYWIDVVQGNVLRKSDSADPDDYEIYNLNIGKIGGIIHDRNMQFLLFANAGNVWQWSAGDDPVFKTQLREAEQTRFNDVIMDPAGRVFCGVAPLDKGAPGSLWQMQPDFTFSCIEPKTNGMPNGMGFAPDLRYFYFTVTSERQIYRYEYCEQTGSVMNKTRFISVPDQDGYPDGLTVDSDGCIWSAQWNGSRLVRYSSQGIKLDEYIFDIEKITSVTFGGEHCSKIFVTTANYPWVNSDWTDANAGAVFFAQKN